MDGILEDLFNCDELKESITPEPALPEPFLKINMPADYKTLSYSQDTGFIYVCGYFAKKLLMKHNCIICRHQICEKIKDLNTEENNFIKNKQYDHVKEGLIVPTANFVDYLRKIEEVIQANFKTLLYKKFIGKKLFDLCKNISNDVNFCHTFPSDLFLKMYIRIRIYYILLFFNQQIKNKVRNLKILNLKNL